jgi:hypothetical protein
MFTVSLDALPLCRYKSGRMGWGQVSSFATLENDIYLGRVVEFASAQDAQAWIDRNQVFARGASVGVL